MVELALLIGIFSYLVFGLGLSGRLNMLGILGVLGVLAVLVLLLVKRNKLLKTPKEIKKDNGSRILVILLLLFAGINLIGALGSELGFDALWYHLTIPKIYLQEGRIFFLRGGLFYYSAMPKLTEMLYLTSLVFSPAGTLAKIIHFSFGILCSMALFNLSRRYLKTKESLLAVLIFYSTLLVGWESITAYVDLARTFFEILALDLFLEWGNERDRGNPVDGGASKKDKSNLRLIESAVMLGLAISTKLIAFASLLIFLVLILVKSKKLRLTISYLIFAVFTVSPWLVFSYVYTGNPIFPIFSGVLDNFHRIPSLNQIEMIRNWWTVLYHPQDLISPVFLIFLPVVLRVVFKGRLRVGLRVVGQYLLLAMVFWYFTPRTGGSRFILPYLPVMSLFLVAVVEKENRWKNYLFKLAIFIAVINLSVRTVANYKYLPVVLGRQTREDFLTNNLKFNNGDFFDIDREIKKRVKDEKVLIYGSHNLFYTDFPFVHESFAQKSQYYKYLLAQDYDLPDKYKNLKLIYQNQKTRVNLFIFNRLFE